MAKSLSFLKQECELTLAEALVEYNEGFPFLNNNDGSTEASHWFRCHDITHILFGTIPFQIRGEAINDTWSLFGTDVTLKGYKKFFNYVDYKTVINSYLKHYNSKARVYWIGILQLPICLVTLLRALRMKKKWPWHNPEPYLNCRICDLRKQFAIKIIHNSNY